MNCHKKRQLKGGKMITGYGEKLRQLRGDKSSAEVAKDLKISDSALRMYETEQRVPRDDIKIALAEYYHTSVESIFFDLKCHK